MARTLHWMLSLSVAAAWLTGRSGPDALRHVTSGVLVALLLVPTLLRALRSGGPGPTARAAASAAIGIGLLLLVGGTGALVLAGEEQWAPSVVAIGTGVRVHVLHDLAAWALVGWVGVHVAGALLHWWRHPPPVRGEVRAAVAALTLTGAVALGFPLIRFAPEARATASDPTFAAACGDCHLAYPPDLLPARSWSRMMDTSADHFGEDLGLAPETSATVRDWLVSHAAEGEATEHAWRIHRSVPADEAPQRITELDWWAQAHDEVPETVFDRPDIRTRGRCQACHPDAAGGAFQSATHLDPERSP